MKDLGFDHWAVPPRGSRAGDPEAEKPTLVQSPEHLLNSERGPRTLPRGHRSDSLLDLEQALEQAADVGITGDAASPATGDDAAGVADDDAWSPRPRSDEASHVGRVIDNRYVVEALIARGGMGIVYRCRHQLIDRKFAVKIIRSTMAHLPDTTRRFLTEAKAASAIGNEHIVDVVDYGSLPDGSAYLVMELLEGQPLSDLIERREMLSVARIAAIAAQICEGLRAAHEAGIVHRDLKPENIFLSTRKAGDFVKILDFGIAKMLSQAEPLTRKGLIMGTPHYMSPEQAAGAAVDARGDIYSLGVILYELATGRVPFDATHYMAVLAKHMTEPPPPFDSLMLPATLPHDFEAIVQKCLAKLPEHRYQSMIEVMDATERLSRRLHAASRPSLPPLSALAPGLDDAARSSSVPAAAGRSVRAEPRAPRFGLLLSAAGMAVLTGLSLWRIQRPDELHAGHAPAAAPLEPPAATAIEPPAATAIEPPATTPPPPAPPAAPTPALTPGPQATSHPADDQTEPLTVVELVPGKSVEIEARTRLSLRLSPEARTPARVASTPRPARKARRAPRPAATASQPTKPEPPPAEPPPSNGLMNPWPAPTKD
jgi:eukaryotic-like serine/threonine-protein kinase